MAALDKKTGRTLWASPPILSPSDGKADGPSYSSPILLDREGMRQVIGCTSQPIIGVDAENGRLLWTSPIPTRYRVLAMTPVICPDGIFMTGPDSGGGKLYRLRIDGDRVMPEAAWTTSIDTCHGGVVLIDGFLYGSWYRSFNGWGCVDLRTGEVRYRTRELAMGSVLHADGRFYILSQTGTMALVRADPKEFQIVSRFSLTEQRVNDAWAHPVIVDGRLYLRYHQKLYCYDIRAK
jgi:outer membrane protein assembly factor BamB